MILRNFATRQQAIFYSIIQNFKEASGAMNEMASSAGTLDSSYAKYLDSATAHLNRFKAQFQDLSQNVVQSYLIGNVADVGTGILWVVNQIAQLIDKLGGLKTAILATVTTVAALKALDTARALELTKAKTQEITTAIFDRKVAVDSLKASIEAMNAQDRESLRTAITKEATVRGLSDAERDQILATAGLTASEKALEAQSQKVAVGFKSIWSSMSLLGKISAVLSIATAVSSLLGLDEKIRNLFKTAEQRIAETADRIKQLQDAANSAVSNFQRLKQSADEVIPRFTELAKGVDEFGRQGTLTNEEYAEFISLNNQLAELFPEINMGMDSNGNAMLLLDYKAQDLEQSIRDLVEAQRELANQKLVDNLGDQYDALSEQRENYQDMIDNLDDRRKALEKARQEFEDTSKGITPISAIGYLSYAIGDEAYQGLLARYTEDGIVDWDAIFNSDELGIALARLDGQIQSFVDRQSHIMSGLLPSLTAFMQNDHTYQGFDDISKQIADAMLKGLDFNSEELRGKTAEEIQEYIVNNIIIPIQREQPKVQEAFTSLLNLSSMLEKGEIEYEDYAAKVREIFNHLFDTLGQGSEEENMILGWLRLLGIEGGPASEVIENLIVKFGGLPGAINGSNEELKKFTELVGDLKSSYDLLAKAQTDMDNPDGNGGLTPDTLKALADAEEDYLKYLYEENGVIKLNTQAYRDYIEQKQKDHLDTLRQQRESITSEMDGIRSSKFSWKQESKQQYAELEESLKDLDFEISVTEYALEQLGDSAEDTADKFNSLQKAIKNVSDKSGGLDTLSKMYEDVKNGGDFDFTSFIDETFVKQFGQYTEAYQALMDTIAESPSDIEACQQAFNDLATEYVYGSGLLDELEEGNKKVIAALLEHKGVANADAIVEAELARQRERVRLETTGVTKKTYDEIIALGQEKNMALATRQALVELAMKKFEVNKNTIKTAADIQNLYDLAKAAGATTSSLEKIAKVKALMADIAKYNELAKSSDSRTAAGARQMISILSKQVEQLIAQGIEFDNAPPAVYYSGGNSSYSGGSGSGSSGGSSGSSGSSGTKAETWFEKQYKEHNHLRDLDKEDTKKYIAWLDSAYQRAYREGILTLDEYRKYQVEVFKGMREIFKDYLNDVEKKIEALEHAQAQNRNIEKIISYYQQLMDAVHQEADRARAQGLTDESDYIQELKEKWYSYREAMMKSRKDWFDELMADRKFAIEQLQRTNADSNKIVSQWSSIISAMQNELSYYLSRGYDATDEVVQDLIKDIWDASDQIVSIANEAVDGLQNVYSTLTDAAKEWAQTGYLSADSLQSILELGPKYLSFLYDENGQLKINEQALQKVLAARTDELAIDTAMTYAKELLAAAQRKDTESLIALTQVQAGNAAATWDLVYATLGMARAMGTANGMTEQYFDDAQDYIDKIRSMSQTTINTISESYMTLNDWYISQADGLESILGYTKELLKFEAEQHIDAIKDELDAYKEIVEAKKESLRLSKEQDKHDRDLADKVAEIAKLQAQIDQLALDDSREARAKRAQLEEQLAEKQKALAESQADYAYDKQVDALDKEYEAFESEKNAEIKALEDMYQSEEALYNAAIERITNGWDDLYQQLIAWNTEYGNELNITITRAWDQAAAAVQRYGSFLDALTGVQSHVDLGPHSAGIINQMRANSLAWFTADKSERKRLSAANHALAESYYNATGSRLTYGDNGWMDELGNSIFNISKDEIAKAIVGAMKQNSAAWHDADDETRNYLAEFNKILAERLAKILGQAVVNKNGTWYLGDKKLYDVYHKGGIAGGIPTLKQNEVLAVLEKGEAVLDKKRESSLYKLVDFAKVLSEKLGSVVDLSKLSLAPGLAGINMISKNTTPPVAIHKAEIHNEVSVQINHSGSFNERDASAFGSTIADAAIVKLNDAFTRRGITAIGNAALKT